MKTTTGFFHLDDGTTLFTRHWHPSEEPHATMLIVHGVSEHTGRYEHVGAFFAEKGFDVHSYDHRGHGHSAGQRIHVESFREYLDDLEAMVGTYRGLGRPLVLYGHSMGGLITVGYLVDGRTRPDAVVLSAPALEADVPGALKLAARILARLAPRARLAAGITGDQLSRDPAVGSAYFADPLVVTKGTARFGAELLAAMDRARIGVGTLDIPALVIHGTDDRVVPPSASAPLAAVAGVDRTLFPGLRHELHNEPEALDVLAHVAEWLDARLAAAAS